MNNYSSPLSVSISSRGRGEEVEEVCEVTRVVGVTPPLAIRIFLIPNNVLTTHRRRMGTNNSRIRNTLGTSVSTSGKRKTNSSTRKRNQSGDQGSQRNRPPEQKQKRSHSPGLSRRLIPLSSHPIRIIRFFLRRSEKRKSAKIHVWNRQRVILVESDSDLYIAPDIPAECGHQSGPSTLGCRREAILQTGKIGYLRRQLRLRRPLHLI